MVLGTSGLEEGLRGCGATRAERLGFRVYKGKTHQDGRRAGWPGNFDEDSGYQRAETKFDEGRGAGRRFDEGREVRRRGRGFDEGRYKRPRQSPKKSARVRRRLNERRRFDEGHKGREGFDEGQGFRRRLGGFDGLCRRLCAIRPHTPS